MIKYLTVFVCQTPSGTLKCLWVLNRDLRIVRTPSPTHLPSRLGLYRQKSSAHKHALVILHSFSFSNGLPPSFTPAMIDSDDVQLQHFLSNVFGAWRNGLLRFSNRDVVKGKLARMSLDKIQDIKTGNHPVLCAFPQGNYINYLLGLETPILISKEQFSKSICGQMVKILPVGNWPGASSTCICRAVRGLRPKGMCQLWLAPALHSHTQFSGPLSAIVPSVRTATLRAKKVRWWI